MEKQSIVRFAPSPTGFLHIGSARTALFNWIFAKKYNAKYMLRVEDTDLNRSKKEYLDEIIDSLHWLGMKEDEVVYQSQRNDIYQEYALKLVEEKKAIKEGDAIILNYPEFEKIEFDDLVRGHIEFNELPKMTEVLIKSDKTATYNFACCVDDALLGITHVIRGEDHIPNTPKQILIYQALGFEVPKFAHLPMILSSEGGKLSKRFGATAIRDYREMGYLPQALVNYLLLLGWSPKNDLEVIDFQKAVKLFDINDINKANAAFSIDKLKWINSDYIKKMSLKELTEIINKESENKKYTEEIVSIFQNRLAVLSDIKEMSKFIFEDIVYSEEVKTILDNKMTKEITMLKQAIEELEDFSHDNIEQMFRDVADDLGLKLKHLIQPARVALTGEKKGPSLFNIVQLLGKEKVAARLKALIEYWNKS